MQGARELTSEACLGCPKMISTPLPSLKVSEDVLTRFSHMDNLRTKRLWGSLWEPESEWDAHSKDGEGGRSLDHQGPATG